jgi:hypothetical protein
MFPGFSEKDFEAYAPNKWKSNVFNRDRLEVKTKLLALGRALGQGLTGADGALLAIDASVEHPALHNHKQVEAQHLFFFRNEGQRKELDRIIDRQTSLAVQLDDPTPQRAHVFLAVTLAHKTLEVALKLHPDARVDRQNLERKVEEHFAREKWVSLVSGLGDPWQTGVTPQLGPVTACDESRMAEALAQLGATHGLFYVGRAIARDEAVAAGAQVADLVRDALARLLPLYHFVAWSRENDFVSIKETLQKEKQQKRQKGLAKNDTVRIVRGILAGKSGVVQEVDAKGGVRVLVGKVAVKLVAEDVAKS